MDLSWIKWHETPHWISAGMCPVSECTCCCAEAETRFDISLAFIHRVLHWGVLRSDAQCRCCWSLSEGQGSTRRSAKHAVPRATQEKGMGMGINGGVMPVPWPLCFK